MPPAEGGKPARPAHNPTQNPGMNFSERHFEPCSNAAAGLSFYLCSVRKAGNFIHSLGIMNRIILISTFSILTINIMAQKKIVQTAGRDQLGGSPPNSPNSTTTSFSARCGAAPTSSLFVTAAW